jgi:hypothetical protein
MVLLVLLQERSQVLLERGDWERGKRELGLGRGLQFIGGRGRICLGVKWEVGEEPKLKALCGGGGESDEKKQSEKARGREWTSQRSLESQVRCLLGIQEGKERRQGQDRHYTLVCCIFALTTLGSRALNSTKRALLLPEKCASCARRWDSATRKKRCYCGAAKKENNVEDVMSSSPTLAKACTAFAGVPSKSRWPPP